MGLLTLIGPIYYLYLTSYSINTPKDHLSSTKKKQKKKLIIESFRESRVRARGKQHFGALLGGGGGDAQKLRERRRRAFSTSSKLRRNRYGEVVLFQ